ncbi:uncharacterized protein LOC133454763 [Cololabis saira]|uniref:uncharacterized protein LOC133454763 n=1 Tax=Cololabis saira TaxID=129043 RepID=UPI002AD251B4|nr:uncharacterized protein LOC133454763 [Cololabis saira]
MTSNQLDLQKRIEKTYPRLWSMRVSQVLQLSVLLLGLCEARGASPTGDDVTSQRAGEVPVTHLRMLSVGLAHLLQGVEENVQRLEQEGELVGKELEGATKGLESLRKQSLQTVRSHRQVRKGLQIHTARRDAVWKAVRDLQKDLEDLQAEQGVMQQQMNRITQSVKRLMALRPGVQTPPDIRLMKVLINKQAHRLANLTSEVTAQERLINRRLRQIQHLEKKLSSGP